MNLPTPQPIPVPPPQRGPNWPFPKELPPSPGDKPPPVHKPYDRNLNDFGDALW